MDGPGGVKGQLISTYFAAQHMVIRMVARAHDAAMGLFV